MSEPSDPTINGPTQTSANPTFRTYGEVSGPLSAA